ncbi:YceI family protein [Limibacter armeniacum]|uniref:YceI family protein n=1 Tax=Limibacter armeniacum TaxID=466084 RepID=UPI002FE60104
MKHLHLACFLKVQYCCLLLLLITFSVSGQSAKEVPSRHWDLHFDDECYLNIKGETNVNNFQCDYNIDPTSDNKEVITFNRDAGLLDFKDSELKVEIKRLDCHNKMMTNDMRDLLDADNFPYLIMELVMLKFENNYESAEIAFNGKLKTNLTIAGQTREVWLPVKIQDRNSELLIKGHTIVDITDFGLTPPTKMLGAVKVRKHIDIQLAFKAK